MMRCSGHGYRALIMALRERRDHARISSTGQMLGRALHSLAESWTRLRCYIFSLRSDRSGKGTLTYANTGHPHAVRQSARGTDHRLSGESATRNVTTSNMASLSWVKKKDLLVLSPMDQRPRTEAIGLGEDACSSSFARTGK